MSSTLPPSPTPIARDPWASVAGRLLLPMQAAWRGSRTHRYLPAVEAVLRLDARSAERWALHRLRLLLAHAQATVPFWRRRMAEAAFDPARVRSIDDLAGLPPLTRDEVVTEAEDLASTAYRGRQLVHAASGGTTSRPVAFAQLPAAVWWKSATAVAFRRRLGWRPGDRAALLWGAMQDLPERVDEGWRWAKARLSERWVDRILWLPAGDFNDELLDDYANRLAAFRPRILQGYPSATDLLARRLLATGRRLSIPRVLLTAEAVFPAQRRRIREALGADVYSFYGAREVGWIANECSGAHHLHINTSGVHVEIGRDGRLLVTDLVDPATPLFRYEIGDRGRLANGPCPCGDPRPVLEALEGRALDIFRLPSGRQVPGVVPDPRNWMIDGGILETQIVQQAADRFLVRYVPTPTIAPGDLDEFERYLDRVFFGEATFEFVRVPRIEPEPNGKVRHCIALPDMSLPDPA